MEKLIHDLKQREDRVYKRLLQAAGEPNPNPTLVLSLAMTLREIHGMVREVSVELQKADEFAIMRDRN